MYVKKMYAKAKRVRAKEGMSDYEIERAIARLNIPAQAPS